jgi:hypothetical protein
MRVKTLCSVMLGMTGLALSMTAQAQDAPAGGTPAEGAAAAGAPPAAPAPEAPPPTATATVAAAGAPASTMRIAINVVPMPFLGKLKASAGGADFTADAAVAFGIMPVFDYLVSPNFFVGVAPMDTLNVKGKDGNGDAAKEIDLMLRIGGGAPVSEKAQIYGYVSPGYSIIQPPSGDSPKGFTVGAHVGGMMDLTSAVFVNLEVGYQLGLQKVDGVDFQTRFFQVGLGAGMHI